MFPFNLINKKWFHMSIVGNSKPNSGGAGAPGAPTAASGLSRNSSVDAAPSGRPSLPRTKSYLPDKAEMRRVFEKFDENKDGVICSKELRRFMKRLGFEMSEDEVASLVKTIDENCDGSVDFDEFYSLYTSLTVPDTHSSADHDEYHEAQHEENLKNAFQVFDQDHDGFISVKELQSVLLTLGMEEGSSVRKCRQMINSVDADGNGLVDFQEFKKLMTSDAFQS